MDYEVGPCLLEQLPALVELANRVFRSGQPGDMGAEYPLVFDPGNVENLRVARVGGRVVSHVGICFRDASLLGASIRVASIGAVATDPEHRGSGLASRLMADARRHAMERGASLMLISGGRGLYHRLGYVDVGVFEDWRAPAGEPDPEYSAEPHYGGDLADVVRLHQAEPVRFHRPLDDWRRILAAGMLMNQPSDLVVIRRGDAAAAYAGVQRPKATDSDAPVRVREIAGSREAIAAALPGIGRRYGAPSGSVIVSGSDTAWSIAAAARGWASTPAGFPGTLGIIDADRFLTAIAPLVEERVGPALRMDAAGDGARLRSGGETVELRTVGELTALVFGGETDEARAVPPPPPAIRAACEVAFPLPLLWYGYNYV